MITGEIPPSAPGLVTPVNFLRTKERTKPVDVRNLRKEWTCKRGLGYELKINEVGVTFTLTRVRPQREEMFGLLTVRADFKGAATIADNILSSADFNISSLRARTERAKHLHERAKAPEIDWLLLLEEMCLRTLHAEEDSGSEILLTDMPSVQNDRGNAFDIAGLPLIRSQPTIWFGDGGCGKSYLSLYAGIALAQEHGEKVLYCDWECTGDDHRRRLDRILGTTAKVPTLWYQRCERSLVKMADRLKEIIARRNITMVICDSAGYATEGAPETAESALGYFRAFATLGPVTSLHLAHINKSETGDQKPFGSQFWHNSARSTWYLKRTDPNPDSSDLTVALIHRKSNSGPFEIPRGMRLSFEGSETRIMPTDPSVHDELATSLPLWQRMKHELEHGPMTAVALGDILGAKVETVSREARRQKSCFRLVVSQTDGIQRIGLLAS